MVMRHNSHGGLLVENPSMSVVLREQDYACSWQRADGRLIVWGDDLPPPEAVAMLRWRPDWLLWGWLLALSCVALLRWGTR